jgi:hypothetical protein
LEVVVASERSKLFELSRVGRPPALGQNTNPAKSAIAPTAIAVKYFVIGLDFRLVSDSAMFLPVGTYCVFN